MFTSLFRQTLLFLSLNLLLWIHAAWADFTFGIELEFMKDRWQEEYTGSNFNEWETVLNAKTKLREAYYRRYGLRADDTVEIGSRGYINFAQDPGVVEIQVGPVTLNELRANRAKISAIYEEARRMRLSPSTWKYGANHIHVGVEEAKLGKNFLAIRNVLADLYNHHEIAEDVLMDDPGNAEPISDLSEYGKRLLREAFAEFDGSTRGYADLQRLTDQTRRITSVFSKGLSSKYQAINIQKLRYDPHKGSFTGTIEIRAMLAFVNPEGMETMLEFLQKRISRIREFSAPIPLNQLKPIRTVQNKIFRFRSMIEEEGLSWKDFKGFLSPAYRRFADTPLPSTLRCKKTLFPEGTYLLFP